MPETEQKTFETYCADAVMFLAGYVAGEVIGWVIAGVTSGLILLAYNYSAFTGVAAISCGTLVLALAAWRSFQADTEAADDPDDNPVKRLINENRKSVGSIERSETH